MNLRKFNKESRVDLELIQRVEKMSNANISVDMSLNVQPYIYTDNIDEGVVYLNSMFRCAPVFIDEPQDGFLRIEYSTIPYNTKAGDEYQKLVSEVYKKDVLGKDLNSPINSDIQEEIDVFTTVKE